MNWELYVYLINSLNYYTFYGILEIKKLFGHTNEVMSMVISPSGDFLATAAKARDAATATILLWSAKKKELVDRLPGHESTVVCLKFSPNNRFTE